MASASKPNFDLSLDNRMVLGVGKGTGVDRMLEIETAANGKPLDELDAHGEVTFERSGAALV